MNTTELTGKVQDLHKRAREKVRDFGQTTDTYVRENTWSTLALAALLGCLVGYVLAASCDRA